MYPFKLGLSFDGEANAEQWPTLTTTLRNVCSYTITYRSVRSPTRSYDVQVERRDAMGKWQPLAQEPVYHSTRIPGTNYIERHGSIPDFVTLRPRQQGNETIDLLGFATITQPGDYRITATISLPDPSDANFDGGDAFYYITNDLSQDQKRAMLEKAHRMAKAARVTVKSNTLIVRYLGNGISKVISSDGKASS